MAIKALHHPLGWGDKELQYLISVGLNPTNLYRAMGYKSQRPSATFIRRLYRLGYVDKQYKDTDNGFISNKDRTA